MKRGSRCNEDQDATRIKMQRGSRGNEDQDELWTPQSFALFTLSCTYFSSMHYSSSMCFSSGEKAECVPPWVGLHAHLHRLQHDVRHPDAHLQLGHQSRQRGICSWISGQCKREADLNILVFSLIKYSITIITLLCRAMVLLPQQ